MAVFITFGTILVNSMETMPESFGKMSRQDGSHAKNNMGLGSFQTI